MKNYILFLIIILFNVHSLTACNLPKSTYEDTKYDKYYGWDKLSLRREDAFRIRKHEVHIRELLCLLRKNNKTRVNYKELDRELLKSDYVRNLILSDGTVPVYKLVEVLDLYKQGERNVEALKTLLNYDLQNMCVEFEEGPIEVMNLERPELGFLPIAERVYYDPYFEVNAERGKEIVHSWIHISPQGELVNIIPQQGLSRLELNNLKFALSRYLYWVVFKTGLKGAKFKINFHFK